MVTLQKLKFCYNICKNPFSVVFLIKRFMKQILLAALAVLFFSCGSVKKTAQKNNDTPTVVQKTIKKPLPPNTASNKYSKKRGVKNQ